jgi:hypothetical protein
MTASPGREVEANLLRGAALGSAQARAGPDDAGRQDLGVLVEALRRGHQVRAERAGQCIWELAEQPAPVCFLPMRCPKPLRGSPCA